MKDIPKQLDAWARGMAGLYNSLEGEIIRIIIRRLNNGHTDILKWQMQALKDMGLYRNDVVDMLAEVTVVAKAEIERMFGGVGTDIIQDVDKAVPGAAKPLPTDLDRIMKAYRDQCWSDINNYINQTLISTNYGYGGTATRAYTKVLSTVQAKFNTGLYTLPQAMQKAISELAHEGIKSTFVDKGGHTWSLERYVRTVLMSTLSNTYNELRTARMAEYGIHTVLVTSHMGARVACTRIQGNVVDLRPPGQIPPDSQYMSIHDAYWQADYGTAGGHRGCNCQHDWIVFVHGVNTNNQPKYDERENSLVRKLKTQQRQLERAVVKSKKNRMVADKLGDKEGADQWGKRVRGYQSRLRSLVGSNNHLYRDYQRERVYTPLDTLLQDIARYMQ